MRLNFLIRFYSKYVQQHVSAPSPAIFRVTIYRNTEVHFVGCLNILVIAANLQGDLLEVLRTSEPLDAIRRRK